MPERRNFISTYVLLYIDEFDIHIFFGERRDFYVECVFSSDSRERNVSTQFNALVVGNIDKGTTSRYRSQRKLESYCTTPTKKIESNYTELRYCWTI